MSEENKKHADIGVRLQRLVSWLMCKSGMHDICHTGRRGYYIYEVRCAKCGMYGMGHDHHHVIVMTGTACDIFDQEWMTPANNAVSDGANTGGSNV